MTATQLNITSRLTSAGRQVQAMESRIHSYLRRRSGVSFVELARDIPGFRGDATWGREDQNIILWADMSPTAIAAMSSLVSSGKIVPTASNWLVYNFDGGVLDMPIAEDISTRYDKPHWLPTVFAGVKEAT